MNTQASTAEAIHEILRDSQAGNLIFPEVVRRMLAVGVESYFVDLPRAADVAYLVDGSTVVDKMDIPIDPVSAKFSQAGIVAAIRAAQADSIRYPEFMRQAAAAGVVAYWAFLTGKRVIYFGRQGEMHIEEFPAQK